jgi:tetratricopeptide (TPR) repeat protein
VPATDGRVWDTAFVAAERAALRALELDPDNASARVALATVFRDRWRWAEAEVEFLKALATDPDNVEAHQQYAELPSVVGRGMEALNSSARALALDRSAIRLGSHANVALANGRVDEAIELSREGIEKDPDNNVNLLDYVLGRAYLQTGRYDEAERLSESRGRKRDLGSAIAALRTDDPDMLDDLDDPIFKAQSLMMMGRPDLALEELDGDVLDPPFMGKADLFAPVFDPIRDDPRVQALLAEMGLEGVEPVRAPPLARDPED